MSMKLYSSFYRKDYKLFGIEMRANGGVHMRYRYVNLIFIFTIFWLSNLTGSVAKSAVVTSSLPSSHFIMKVPLYKQLNGLDCGPASIEMVFDYWGEHIDQKAIADVARTSSNGTYTWDIVRTGHFSHKSSAQGRFFPHDAPTAGFPERPLGYASFYFSSNAYWLNELKGLIASDIPVILLMKYSPDDETGHYRVIVGYDEEYVYFKDPWDRGLGKDIDSNGMVRWEIAKFIEAWNYKEYGAPSPYWGAVMMPWSIDLTTIGKMAIGSSIKVTAVISYPCPKPFDSTKYPASKAKATICLPEGMTLLDGSPKVEVGTLLASMSVTVSWRIKIDQSFKYEPGLSIKVSAWGEVSGSVPDANWKGKGFSYDGYTYTDLIGGNASVPIDLRLPSK